MSPLLQQPPAGGGLAAGSSGAHRAGHATGLLCQRDTHALRCPPGRLTDPSPGAPRSGGAGRPRTRVWPAAHAGPVVCRLHAGSQADGKQASRIQGLGLRALFKNIRFLLSEQCRAHRTLEWRVQSSRTPLVPTRAQPPAALRSQAAFLFNAISWAADGTLRLCAGACPTGPLPTPWAAGLRVSLPAWGSGRLLPLGPPRKPSPPASSCLAGKPFCSPRGFLTS